MNLLEELDVEIYDQWNTGSKIMQASDGIIKTYSNPLPPLSYLALLDMWWFTYKVSILYIRHKLHYWSGRRREQVRAGAVRRRG